MSDSERWVKISIPNQAGEELLKKLFGECTRATFVGYNSILVKSKTPPKKDEIVFFLGFLDSTRGSFQPIWSNFSCVEVTAPPPGFVEFVAGEIHFGNVVK